MAVTQNNKGLLVILTITCVCGFNVDTQIPFIRRGPTNSYFGFSLAEHQITNSEGSVIENVLLVGSPKLSRPGDNDPNTGGLYKCSFNSWCDESCDIQIQAEADNVTAITGTRTDQWFGSLVRSSGKGGYVVVCAHRYSINYSGVGKCVALHKNLYVNKLVTPCKEDPLEHKGESYCQAGTSAEVDMDGTVVVGGPGSGDWTGAVYTLLVKRQLGVSLIYYSSPWRKESEAEDPPIDLHSYMGYSVTSGHYHSTNPSNKMYVGGAPHSNGTGCVVLFYQKTGGYLNYHDNQILVGEKEFSLFGFDLATLDLNGDGYDDLVVGAPLYYEKKKAGGAIYVYMGKDGGISESDVPKKITNHKDTEEECTRVTCTESRFGFSVSPAGDVNLDGYQDLVVGAPYESDGRGAVYLFHGSENGIVEKYAQRISANDIDSTVKTFGYAVSGKMDLDNNGYDDISVGAYQSDTAYLLRTRPIVHLTANISVSPKKFNLSQAADCSIPGESSKKYCMDLSLCMSFSAKPKASFSATQKIFYRIEVEKDVRKKRAIFVNIDPMYPGGSVKEDVANLPEQDRQVCRTEKIKLVDNFNDKLTPIDFFVTYSLADNPFPTRDQCSNGVPDINEYPVLTTGKKETSSTLITEVEFSKECGTNDICESNIQMTTDILKLNKDPDGTVVLSFGEDEEVVVDIQLRNVGEPAYETMLYTTVPEVFGWKDLDPVFPPNAIPVYSNYNSTTVVISDIGNPFGNRDKSTNFRHYRLRFDSRKLTRDEQTFTIRIKVNTTSEEQTLGDDEQTINVRVINRAEVELQSVAEPDGDVFYKGPVRGESSMKKESDIGPAINHTFIVVNHGPGAIGGATLRIYWPYELKTPYTQGKHLLYLMQPPVVVEGPAECPGYPEYVNTLNVQPSYTITQGTGPGYTVVDSGRKKRETKQSTPSQVPPARIRKGEYSSKNVVILDCNDKANCYVMECRIKRLEKNTQAKILLRARLWESTLVQDYPSADEVWVRSTGQVILDKVLNIEQNTTDDQVYATTYTISDLEARITEEIKWWIILVAVLAGIVVLIIFILILWKCGFFKRLRPEGYEPTYKGDLTKNKYSDNMNESAYS